MKSFWFQFHFGLLLDTIRHVEHRGYLSKNSGELVDTPLESIFVSSSTLDCSLRKSLTPLEQIEVFDEKKTTDEGAPLSDTRIFSDVIIVADGAPSWARRCGQYAY